MTTREEQLRRAAEVRALIIPIINTSQSAYLTQEDIHGLLGDKADSVNLNPLLRRMVSNGLIKEIDIRKEGKSHKKGYTKTEEQEGVVAIPKKYGKRKIIPSQIGNKPEIRVEANRIVIEHSHCRVVVEFVL